MLVWHLLVDCFVVAPVLETRWVAWHTAFAELAEMYETLFLCLEEISLDNSPEET